MQVKLEDIQKKNSGFDNYSQGLGQILRGNEERQQPGLKQGEDFNDLQEGTRQATIMPPNSISTTNGIWDEAALRQISGWREAFKSETLISTMETLREFHSEMRKEISAEWMGLGDSANEVRESYEELLKKVSHYVQRGSKWNAFVHLHRKEEKAMLPAMSVLLIKLYSLGNVFENIKNLTFDYMVENGKTVAKISDIITSSMAGSLQGNMAFTGMQTNQTDKTSYQMRKETSGEEYSAKDEIKTMQL